MSEPRDEIDWDKTTFDGSRREQLLRWRTLTVRERLEVLDAMTDLAERMEVQSRHIAVCVSRRRKTSSAF